jgi:hypothetical protein
MKPTGVRTNGIGERSTAHLNLTVTLADAWAAEDAKPVAKPKPRKMGRPKGPNLIRPRFAGDDRHEGSAA